MAQSNSTNRTLSRNNSVVLSIPDLIAIGGFLISVGVSIGIYSRTKDDVDSLKSDLDKSLSELQKVRSATDIQGTNLTHVMDDLNALKVKKMSKIGRYLLYFGIYLNIFMMVLFYNDFSKETALLKNKISYFNKLASQIRAVKIIESDTIPKNFVEINVNQTDYQTEDLVIKSEKDIVIIKDTVVKSTDKEVIFDSPAKADNLPQTNIVKKERTWAPKMYYNFSLQNQVSYSEKKKAYYITFDASSSTSIIKREFTIKNDSPDDIEILDKGKVLISRYTTLIFPFERIIKAQQAFEFDLEIENVDEILYKQMNYQVKIPYKFKGEESIKYLNIFIDIDFRN